MTLRGWCPTLFAPMSTGDGLLLRVKPRLGVLTTTAAYALAEASARLGNGMIGLTNRGNLQLRGFTEASAKEFATIAVELGLAHPDPDAEARRNVLVSPLIGLDPQLDPATFDVARMLDDLLARRPEFAPLPGKFGLVVDGGGLLPVGDSPGDILLQPLGEAVSISLDGGDLAAHVPLLGLRDVMQRLLLAFLDDGDHRRMRDANAARIFTAAGLVADMPRRRRVARSPIGALPGAFGVGLPFGLLSANELCELADIATQQGDATMRLTPWRALVLPEVAEFAPHANFITDPTDPITRVEACPGAPSCSAASVNTLEAARLMAKRATWQGRLHVSGCAKGCAYRGMAALTLVGENGAWNLIRDGRVDSRPSLRGVAISSITEMVRSTR